MRIPTLGASPAPAPTPPSSPTSGASAATSRATEVVAHRGYHATGAMQNTVAAYLEAIRLGVDVMETDVRSTSDGVLVLAHDAWIQGCIISRTRYADLPRLANGERVSTLQGLVDAVAGAGGHTKLLVETKGHGAEAQVVGTIRSRLRADQFELMSFDQASVRALRAIAPDVRVGVLFGLYPDWDHLRWPITGAAMVQKARELGVDFVAIDRHIASNASLDALAGAGISTGVWTVDDRDDLARYLGDPRVSRIITDAPDVAMSMRDRAPVAAFA